MKNFIDEAFRQSEEEKIKRKELGLYSKYFKMMFAPVLLRLFLAIVAIVFFGIVITFFGG